MEDDEKKFTEDMTFFAKEAEKPPAQKFTSEAFKKAFDAMLSRRPKTFNEMLKVINEQTRPNSKYLLPRSLAAELGIDVSKISGNLVVVHNGTIEGMYVEPEEVQVEKKSCEECADTGYATYPVFNEADNSYDYQDDYCPFLHEPWHHPLP